MLSVRRKSFSLAKHGVLLIIAVVMSVAMGCHDSPPAEIHPGDTVRTVFIPESFAVIHQDIINPVAGGNEASDNFGSAVVAGDFNCDDHQDLAIAIPGENGSVGAVSILFWDGSAVDPEYPFDEGIVLFRDDIGIVGAGAAMGSDLFGHTLVVGNFDGDTCDDLAIGAPGAEGAVLGDTNQGVFQVRYGDDISPLADGVEAAWLINDEDHQNDQLGSSFAVGDFNGDQVDDLAIGAYGAQNGDGKPNAGKVYVCYGLFGSGLETDLNQLCDHLTPSPIASHEENMRFGFSLAAGDFNGQEEISLGFDRHIDDLAIGAPGDAGSNLYGRVFIRPGTEDGVFPDTDYYYGDSPCFDFNGSRRRRGPCSYVGSRGHFPVHGE